MELIFALKEGVVASFISMLKEEEGPTDGGNSSFEDTKETALASSQPSITLLQMVQARHELYQLLAIHHYLSHSTYS